MIRKLVVGMAWTVVLAGVALALAAIIAGQPAVLERISRASGDWILGDYSAGSSGLSAVRRKLLATYLQHRIAHTLAPPAATEAEDEVERIMAAMQTVRSFVLDHSQVPHAPRNRAVMIAGIGVCDQTNGVVADILAQSFDRSEIFALYDPVLNWSPHTVGRVWSDRHRDWLYFDAIYRDAVVFRKIDGRAVIVARSEEPRIAGGQRAIAPSGFYDLEGEVLNEYRSTFAAYLAAKAVKRWRSGAAAPVVEVAVAAPPAAPGPRRGRPAPPRNDAVFEQVKKTYLEARITHLFHGIQAARPLYRAVGSIPGASSDARSREFVQASRLFASSGESSADSVAADQPAVHAN